MPENEISVSLLVPGHNIASELMLQCRSVGRGREGGGGGGAGSFQNLVNIRFKVFKGRTMTMLAYCWIQLA